MKTFTLVFKTIFFTLLISAFTSVFSRAQTVLYCTTENGGIGSAGAIIQFNPATMQDSDIAIYGQEPFGSLTYDAANGIYYGMTLSGGGIGEGEIYSFNPATKAVAGVWAFGSGSDGYVPQGNLVYDSIKGLFYGMTSQGGTSASGIIFSFNPDSNTEHVVWNFQGPPSDGFEPEGDLAYDPNNGRFYAMTLGGGNNSLGTIISFNPANNTDSLLWSFGNGSDGSYPFRNLVYNPLNKSFYGLTSEGGTNTKVAGGVGTIISFNPSTNTEAVLWSFGYFNDGTFPYGDMVYFPAKNLFYGTTTGGGANSGGTIFTFNTLEDSEHVVYSFETNNTDGHGPQGDLTYYADSGLFYCTTVSGGYNLEGAITSFNPVTKAENLVWSFGAGFDGQNPKGNLVLYKETKSAGITTLTNSPTVVHLFPNPNNGNFTLQMQNVKQHARLEIFNVLGEMVYEESIFNSTTTVNLINQKPGIYLYRVLDNSANLLDSGEVVME